MQTLQFTRLTTVKHYKGNESGDNYIRSIKHRGVIINDTVDIQAKV